MKRKPSHVQDHAQAVLQAFSDALARLATTMALPEASDLALSLLFWHIVSARREMRQYKLSNLSKRCCVNQYAIERVNHDGLLYIQEATSFGVARKQAAMDANAIQAALAAFCQAQAEPVRQQLTAALRPARFGVNSPLFPQGYATPALTQLCLDIARVSWSPKRGEPELDFSLLFGQALQRSGATGKLPSLFAAQVLAQLLHPCDRESVFDPTCGAGELLAACGTVAGGNWNFQANLCGYDARPEALALAQLLFLANQFGTTQLEKRGILTADTRPKAAEHAMPQADVLVLALPDEAMPALATSMAFLKHALFCMKQETGRAGMVMSKTVFESTLGVELRSMLKAYDWLDAIVALPAETQEVQQVLLLIRQKRNRSDVALIVPTIYLDYPGFRLSPYHVDNAYQAFIKKHPHIDYTAIVA